MDYGIILFFVGLAAITVGLVYWRFQDDPGLGHERAFCNLCEATINDQTVWSPLDTWNDDRHKNYWTADQNGFWRLQQETEFDSARSYYRLMLYYNKTAMLSDQAMCRGEYLWEASSEGNLPLMGGEKLLVWLWQKINKDQKQEVICE